MAAQRYRKTVIYGNFYEDDARFIKCCVELIFVAEFMKRLIGRLEKDQLYPGRLVKKRTAAISLSLVSITRYEYMMHMSLF